MFKSIYICALLRTCNVLHFRENIQPVRTIASSTNNDDNIILQEILSKVRGIDTRIDSIDTRIDSIDTRIDSIDTRIDSMGDDITNMGDDITSMRKDMNSMRNNLNSRLNALEKKVGVISEKDMRSSAATMFGESFSKSFTIKSLHDAIALLSKANFVGLSPENRERQVEKAVALAKSTEKFMVPLAEACLLSMRKYLESIEEDDKKREVVKFINQTRDNFDKGHHKTGLGKLIAAAELIPDRNACMKLARLKMAFPTNEDVEENISIYPTALLLCEGPGVMLLDASKYRDLASKDNIFEKGVLLEEVEFDMRGSIELINGYARIACGEAKSSTHELQKAKKQIEVRLNFMKTVVEHVYPGKFNQYVLVGRIFLPKYVKDEKSQLPEDQISRATNVSFYHHFV